MTLFRYYYRLRISQCIDVYAINCLTVCPLRVFSRFALVCVGSEASSRKLMELLSKRELHGQNPIVTPCNKQSLSQFEMQSRKSKEGKCAHGLFIRRDQC